MSNVEVGKLITGSAQRDAIHVAVAPLVSQEKLWPGQPIRVWLIDSKWRAIPAKLPDAIGIVDPFLRDPVYPEQEFWMFLFPGSVSDLRHDWSHPAFAIQKVVLESESVESVWDREDRIRCAEEGCSY